MGAGTCHSASAGTLDGHEPNARGEAAPEPTGSAPAGGSGRFGRPSVDPIVGRGDHTIVPLGRLGGDEAGDTGRAGTPEGTHGRAILARLLIDLSWASSHLKGNTAPRQTPAKPDPLRLAYRDVIRQSVRDVVRRPGEDSLDAIRLAVEGWADTVADADRKSLEALVVE